MTFKIEKGIIAPAEHSKYPWTEMEVGDSFFVPEGKLSNVSSAASYAGKTYKMKFSTKSKNNGIRVWRIK